MKHRTQFAIAFSCFLLPLVSSATLIAADSRTAISGPVNAKLIRVIDGDTILVDAEPWPQQRIEVAVRLRGIDTPERHSDCAEERAAAQKSLAALTALIADTETLLLADISADKYFGRVIADVYSDKGRNPAKELLAAGLAFEYDGKKKGRHFCLSDQKNDLVQN